MNRGYLLDTNVVSEPRKRRPNPGVTKWLDSVDADGLLISVLVVGELQRGIELLAVRDPSGAEAHREWVDRLRGDFAHRILPITTEVAAAWGSINVARPLPAVDSLMAATALVHGLTFVTRDSALNGTGVPLLNPFSD